MAFPSSSPALASDRADDQLISQTGVTTGRPLEKSSTDGALRSAHSGYAALGYRCAVGGRCRWSRTVAASGSPQNVLCEDSVLETLGFCPVGEAWRFIQDGRIDPKGDFPLASGGSNQGLGSPVTLPARIRVLTAAGMSGRGPADLRRQYLSLVVLVPEPGRSGTDPLQPLPNA